MRFARSHWGGRVAGWMFAKMSFALPVKRVIETEQLLDFLERVFYNPNTGFFLRQGGPK